MMTTVRKLKFDVETVQVLALAARSGVTYASNSSQCGACSCEQHCEQVHALRTQPCHPTGSDACGSIDSCACKP